MRQVMVREASEGTDKAGNNPEMGKGWAIH